MRHKKQFLVIGLGRFGFSVAKSLGSMGYEVLAVDEDQTAVEAVTPYVTQAVVADAADDEVLASFDPQSFDAAVICIGGNVENSVLIALQCKEAGIPMVVAKAHDERHAKVLSKIGVDRVIFPERDMGCRLANSLVSPGVIDIMDLGEEFRIMEIMTPPSWYEKTLIELNVRRRYGVSVIAIHTGTHYNASPDADSLLHEGDTLVLLGSPENIQRVEQIG